jgi:hypothetical protein
MHLTWVLRLHAISAGIFGAALLASPSWVASLMTPGQPLEATGVTFGRLYGLMCAFLVVITLCAAASRSAEVRLFAAKCLLACEAGGVLVALTFPSGPEWALTKWFSVALYAVFALAYAWIIFFAPGSARADYVAANSAAAS